MDKSYEDILRLLSFFADADPGSVFRGSSQFMEGKGLPVEGDAARDPIEKGPKPSDEPLYVLTIGFPANVSSAILMESRINE